MRKIHRFFKKLEIFACFGFGFHQQWQLFFLGNWKDLPVLVLVLVAFIFSSLRSAVLREFGKSCTRESGASLR